jgi:zinc protease
MKRLCMPFLAAALALIPFGRASAVETVALESQAPLVDIKIMARAGSANDPAGLEGAAQLAAGLLIEGGFGDPKDPVTKEKLAELTRPWGSRAYPTATVSKETTVFSFKVPREAVQDYVDRIIRPMFNQPLFDAKELERMRGETLQGLRSSLRLEQLENLGSVALDNVIYEGTAYAHPTLGTERGLSAVQRDDAVRFFRTYYQPERIVLGLSADDPSMEKTLTSAFRDFAPASDSLQLTAVERPRQPEGRSVLIVALPNAISTGIHAGFPLDVTRKDPDYWPLYVANIWFGAHRDEFSHLFQVLREQRGYNYGDYSYIEHFEDAPDNLFPPPNNPYRFPAFSIWVRPVAHAYAPHVVRAITWELENFVRTGLSEDECELAKKKARILYLSLAETTERQLASRLDDRFFGLDRAYLGDYLKNVDGVRCGDVNGAIARHLQAKNLDYVIVTSESEAPKIAEALTSTAPVWGKAPSDYQIDVKQEDGKKLYLVPEPKLEILGMDAVWAHEPLELPKDRIRIVPAAKLFETSELPR